MLCAGGISPTSPKVIHCRVNLVLWSGHEGAPPPGLPPGVRIFVPGTGRHPRNILSQLPRVRVLDEARGSLTLEEYEPVGAPDVPMAVFPSRNSSLKQTTYISASDDPMDG